MIDHEQQTSGSYAAQDWDNLSSENSIETEGKLAME